MSETKPETVSIVAFDDQGQKQGTVSVPKVIKSEEAWRQLLGEQVYDVTRAEGTERAFTGALWNNHEHGIYRCVCCGNALFSSDTKFDSGTGWPSFSQPLAQENVETEVDRSFGMTRTEVRCRECEAHLGHVFSDGPAPTGQRYCMNSAALRFVKS